tara:strand:- start:2232 stop:2345 length:114 start_codon:yes stop_codon:yes gene_type:complete
LRAMTRDGAAILKFGRARETRVRTRDAARWTTRERGE